MSPVTRGDRMLIWVLSALIVASVPVSVLAAGDAGASVAIDSPSGTTVLSLSEDATCEIDGRLGPVRVVVAEGDVRVAESCCRDHTCMAMGPIRAPGQAILCVPNGVTVRVEGESDGSLDAVVR